MQPAEQRRRRRVCALTFIVMTASAILLALAKLSAPPDKELQLTWSSRWSVAKGTYVIDVPVLTGSGGIASEKHTRSQIGPLILYYM
jgi:hypothetical protein